MQFSNNSDDSFSFLVVKYFWFTFEKIHVLFIFSKVNKKKMAIKNWNCHLNCWTNLLLTCSGFYITQNFIVLLLIEKVMTACYITVGGGWGRYEHTHGLNGFFLHPSLSLSQNILKLTKGKICLGTLKNAKFVHLTLVTIWGVKAKMENGHTFLRFLLLSPFLIVISKWGSGIPLAL